MKVAVHPPLCRPRERTLGASALRARHVPSLTCKFFFRCAQVASITQYGENPLGGASGYLFDNGDGLGTFLTTALDVTLEGDPFTMFALWRNTPTCFGG